MLATPSDNSEHPTSMALHDDGLLDILLNDYPLERCVLDYATSLWRQTAPSLGSCDHAGELLKLGKRAYYRRWQTRWCVLKARVLFYFKSHKVRHKCFLILLMLLKDTEEPLGLLFLDNHASIETAVMPPNAFMPAQRFVINITVNLSCAFESRRTFERRCYSFAAANQDELDLWVAALSRACHMPPASRTPSIYSAPPITPPVDLHSSDLDNEHDSSSGAELDSRHQDDDRPSDAGVHETNYSHVKDETARSSSPESRSSHDLEQENTNEVCTEANSVLQEEQSVAVEDSQSTIPLGDRRLSLTNRFSQTSSPSRISSTYSDSASMVTQIPLPLHLSVLRIHLNRHFPNFRVLVFVSFNEIAKYIEYTADAMDLSDNRRAINFLDPATKLVRKIRELLYTSDALFLKNFKNEEVSATLTRYMTVVIDRIRRVGLEAKQVTEEESMGIIRTTAIQQIYEHLCFLTRETWLFVSLCVRLSFLDSALHDETLLIKEIDPQGALSRMIQCVLDVSVRLCYCINTQSKTNFVDICNYLWNLFMCVLNGILKHQESCLKSVDSKKLADLRETSRWCLEDEELSLLDNLEQSLLALQDSGNAASGLWPPLHADMIMADRFFTLTNLLLRLMHSSFLLGFQNDWLNLESSFLSLNVQLMTEERPTFDEPTQEKEQSVEPIHFTMPTPPLSIPCTPPPTAVLPVAACHSASVCSEHPHLERHFLQRKAMSQRRPRPTHPLPIPQSQEDYLKDSCASSVGTSFDMNTHDEHSVNMAISKSTTEYVKIVMHATKQIREAIFNASYQSSLQEFFIDFVGESTERIVTAATQITEDIAALECQDAPEFIFANLESARSYLARTVHDTASLIKAHPEEPHANLLQQLDNVDESCRNVLLAVSNIVFVHADVTNRETRTPSEVETDILLGRMSLNAKKSSSNLVDERVMVRRNLSHAVDTFSPANESVEDAQKFVESILEKENEALKSDPDIVYRLCPESQEPLVRGGTLEKLIERLTFYKYPAADFMAAFLLTYRSFTTPSELLELLMCRYRVIVPDDLTKKQKQIYNSRKIIPIKLRVLNVCKMWIKSNFEDFVADYELLEKLRSFTQEMKKDFHKGGADFEALLEKKTSEKRSSMTSSAITQRHSVLSYSFDTNADLFRLIDIDPTILAQQITIIQWEMFSAIGPHECLNQSWNKKELQHRSPHIRQMIRFSNFLVQWIATEIVSLQHARTRASIVKHFILVAEKLHALNNFDGLKGVLFGLQASGISRLKKTWDLVPGKFKASMEYLSKLMGEEKSCKNYRNLLHSIDPPCIPFLGVYLTDLTMIEAGNSDFINNDNRMINFHKRFLVAQVINELKRYQCTAYSFSREDNLYSWILTRPTLDAEAVYSKSLVIEPRPNRLSQLCSNFDPNTAFNNNNNSQPAEANANNENDKNEENNASTTFETLSRRPSAGALLRRLSTRQ